MQRITTHDELREIIGTPIPRVADKVRRELHDLDREWLAASPLCLVATSDPAGNLDVSPKGDPPGFALVLDPVTIAIPERSGNRRADGFHNIVDNPHVGLLFLVPGRGDTLRINGKAHLVRDEHLFDRMVVHGHRPVLALVVEIEEVFYHCSKAFLRSSLWDTATWAPEDVPSRPVIAKTIEQPQEPLASLEEYYGSSYAARLYS
ncbi:phosphohydrolase [Paractinoplanes deccanensis]|uniref:Phosphohydrolase n=1 Tax=Paractinoplanes deccanensis TaxID=113561 RepID=A0ABQ3Y763_9ACTN|nr:pyridoxamine 5'-phosphate oxidase family protein [Actinoplanes deccanensis]GID75705.1 phosphohydrolase [Actinoplanes deccanensis]